MATVMYAIAVYVAPQSPHITVWFPAGQDLLFRTVQTGATVNQAMHSVATRVPAPGVKRTRHDH
jgi:hypothetical protein